MRRFKIKIPSMRKILDILYSTKLTIILLLVFAVAIGTATFIEDKYDTITSKILVYNAKWFEVLLLLLAINFWGHISKYKMFSKQKAAGFIFHFAFILLIVGAGITRYTGFEGSLHVREGQASNVMYVSETYFQVKTPADNEKNTYDLPFYATAYLSNSFNINMDIKNKGELTVKFNKYVPNAIEKMEENVADGKNILELQYVGANGREVIYLTEGNVENIGSLKLAFNNNSDKSAFQILDNGGNLNFINSSEVITTDMGMMRSDTLPKDSLYAFTENTVYSSNGIMFMYVKEYKKAKKQLVSGEEGEQGTDAILVDVSLNGKETQVPVFGGPGVEAQFQNVNIDGTTIQFAYGEKAIELPFSIYLNDFKLDRYAGSMSPSSYESNVTLTDSRNNLKEEHRIYMNNVLDYDGYRFFQSSYDRDELGTVLSVNHDFWGTWISYTGYFLLAVGFFFVMITKNSRFSALKTEIKKIREKRKAASLTALLLLGFIGSAFSAETNNKAIDRDHAEKFGHLIVQSFDGRFQPVHTLAIDAMHKISRQDKFDLPGKGEMDDMQAFMDMFMDPEYWKGQKIIYMRDKVVRERLGIKDTYAAFNDFFDEKGNYKLGEYAETAFRKKQGEQNTFDKEIIKIDERINVCMMVFQGSMLKIFPDPNSTNNKWVSWSDTAAFRPLGGILKIINDDLKLPNFTYNSILNEYFTQVLDATKTGDYSKADKILGYIEGIQRQSNISDILPSETKVNLEIYYNKANIFVFLRNVYGVLSFILLILAFAENLRTKKSKWISRLLNVFIGLLGIAFLYHTYGMGLRWYLSGHAPWSNGYEALLLVAWGGILAGFTFVRYSKITVAATAVLAFSMLMTAGHSSYDPQLTNLVPVLKSYWLIIHVAAITISYGFLGLGFFLGVMNMFLYIFKTKKKAERFNLLIKELTFINEMNLSVGLALATLGTFLGGIWANESWGRYWGWDAKETWALVIVIVYALILHLRLVPKFKGTFIFNVSSIVAFGSVLMTFIGVNYYLSKGLHSYGAGDTPVFPIWAWIMILCMILFIITAGIRHKMSEKE